MTIVLEVMRIDLVTVDPSATMREAAHAMFAGRAGSALVVREGGLLGIFTERDLMRALAFSYDHDLVRSSPVSLWMTEHPVTIRPDATVGRAVDVMLSRGFRHLPVMQGETLLGMVSMRDLAETIARE